MRWARISQRAVVAGVVAAWLGWCGVAAAQPEPAGGDGKGVGGVGGEGGVGGAVAQPAAAPGAGEGSKDSAVELAPGSADAKPGVVYRWTSNVKGLLYDEEGKVKPSQTKLRYTWVLPAGYEAGKPCNLVVICHGTGLDYRWGHWNFKPEEFRPGDVVVSVDGPTEVTEGPTRGTRLFLGMRADALAFRAFLLEAGRAFRAKRIYLYGHSQGSFFVVYFAGEFPKVLDGVVAQSSGAWDWSKETGDVQGVPMVFLHGTSDPVVPYDQSSAAARVYRESGHPMVHLRRMARFNHWPSPARASEEIDWCIGMKTEDGAEALAMAERMLAPKGPDKYEYTCPVDYGGARSILRRLEAASVKAPPAEDEEEDAAPPAKPAEPLKEKPPGFRVPALKDVEESVKSRAVALAARVEAEGQKHVDVLKARVKSKADITIEGVKDPAGCAWIGHLVSVREDFRGVDSVEVYVKEIGLDELLAEHAKAAGAIEEAWYTEGGVGGPGSDPKGVFLAAIEHLPKCFLHEGLPPTLPAKLAEWRRKADALAIPAEATGKYGVVEAWRVGWDEGLKAYAGLWKQWK